MSELEVVPVDDRAGISAFIAAGRRAQSVNPRWVEPVHEEIRMTFDRRRSPFLRENVIQPFVAFRNGEPVGRIVATIEAAHPEKFSDACGFFGFIDAVDDHAVFAALFADAERFLRERGMRLARGPFSLTINHESGLLVHGFDAAARRSNQPFAAPLRRAYRGARLPEGDGPGRLCLPGRGRRTRRSGSPGALDAAKPIRLDIHSLSFRNWGRDFPRVLALYNDAWSDNAWATPVVEEEAKFIADLTLPACKPRLDPHRDLQGRGCRGRCPDPRRERGAPGPARQAAAVRIRAVPVAASMSRGTRMTRVPMAGVAKKWRNTEIAAPAPSALSSPGDRGRARGRSRRDRIQLDAGDQRRSDQRRAQRAGAPDPHLSDLRAVAGVLSAALSARKAQNRGGAPGPAEVAGSGRRDRGGGERRSPPSGDRARGECAGRRLRRSIRKGFALS